MEPAFETTSFDDASAKVLDEAGETTPKDTTMEQETPQPEVQAVADVPAGNDIDAMLAAKDAEIKRLTSEFQAAKNERHLTKGEITAAQVALAEAVKERERLVSEKDAALAKATEELQTVSEATQTLSEANAKLAAEYEASLAKATKLEVMTEEFPELLRYSKLIVAHKDPDVVRAACLELAAARQADMEAARLSAVTGSPITGLPTQPQRNEPTLTDSGSIRNYLAEARNDPKEYERRRQTLLDRIAAAAQRAS